MRAREYKFFQAAPTPRMRPRIGIVLQHKVKTGTGAAKTGAEVRPELEMGLALELGLTLGIKLTGDTRRSSSEPASVGYNPTRDKAGVKTGAQYDAGAKVGSIL